MFTKQQFLDSVAHEHKICKHIFSEIPPESLDGAPGEKMRSGLELLCYLTRCGAAPARALIRGSWEGVREDADKNAHMKAQDFPARMDDQLGEMQELLDPLSDEDLLSKDTVLPWGAPCKLGEGLVNTSLRFLAAYRMQLFLYAKLAGKTELGTVDCWFGAKAPA